MTREALLAAMAVMLIACTANETDVSVDAPISRLGETAAARVDGTVIYVSDVERAALSQGLVGAGEALPPDTFATVLDGLIEQRLLAQDAARQGLDRDDEARRRLQSARERILGNYRVERALDAGVTDSSVRNLYEAQAELANRGEERRLRQIVVRTEDAAQAVLARLADEEDFEDIVDAVSIDRASNKRGGVVGWVSADMLPGPLRGPVFGAGVGTRTAPIRSPAGWHIIEVLDRRDPTPRSFEDTRDDIARYLTFQTIDTLVQDLRDSADIEILTPDVIEPEK